MHIETSFAKVPLSVRKQLAVVSTGHDYLPLIEEESFLPPVAFETFELLDNWRNQFGLCFEEGWKPPKSVLVLKGSICGWPYRQVWAHIDSCDYRNGIEFLLADFFFPGETFSEINADHVIAKKRFVNCSHAWINIFPVWGSANQNFGWIEKLLPKVSPGFKVRLLPATVSFKLFRKNTRLSKTKSDTDVIRGAIDDAAGRVIQDTTFALRYVSAMRRSIHQFYPRH